MLLRDFIFSYYQSLKNDLYKNKKIKKISVENSRHYINGINISEILFIEKE